jgi:hypothetical protein
MALKQLSADGSFQIGNTPARSTYRETGKLGPLADTSAPYNEREERQRDEIKAIQIHFTKLQYGGSVA